MSEYFITSDGAKISYNIQGKGQPVCFIHGFSLDKTMWEKQMEYFSPHFRVLTYDLRGFGESSLPEGPYSHHSDLASLLQYLEISKIHLVGLSLGGEIAIDFFLEYPQFVKSLTLINSSLSGFSSTVDWNVHAHQDGIEIAKKRWMNHEVFGSIREKPEILLQLQKILDNYSGWHWLHDDPRTKPLPLAIERLSEIKVPTQIIVGQKDLSYFHEISDVLEKGISDSKKTIIPDTGHMANIESSSVVNSLIEQLVSTSSQSSLKQIDE